MADEFTKAALYGIKTFNKKVKEKIGMGKLIELLNEREEKEKTSKIEWRIDNNPTGIYGYVGKYGLGFASKMIIISKEYGFIKWLVENDKIDIEKLDEKAERKPRYTFINDDGKLGFKLFEVYESLLMLLAIQDESIDFLISILR